MRAASRATAESGFGYNPKAKGSRIAIHCLAGLGRQDFITILKINRAPVLVAIAMIKFGSTPENAIALIRK